MSDDGADETATKREGVGTLHMNVPGLDRGNVVGRYIVLDVIGQGGMGIIYAAYDPELDRKVAVKLLQAGSHGSASTSAGSQAWLLREAQAMARLSHPNVVAVHDVGVLDDRVFIAMELVDGGTLREWTKQTEHTWREVLDVMRAAGAGLAAAHAVGLVHRDFKPDNVLVGKDGRVRVMDFGLARLRPEEQGSTPASRDSDLSIEVRSPLSESLTEAGTVMGTPAYMAPEIHDGLGANARSDQFAFGVALYEALYRIRPFDKADLGRSRKQPPVPKPAPDIGLPAALQRVVLRAIAADPEARFPSMDALLVELALDPFARRRRIAVAAGVGLVAASFATGAVLLNSRHHHSALCTGTERALVGVWDPATKLKVHTGFTATKKPYADAAYAGLERALDHYVKDWTETTAGNCEATRIRGEQSEHVFEARQLCLDQRLEEVNTLGKLLEEPNDALVDKADKAVYELEPIAACANSAALVTPGWMYKAKYKEVALELSRAHAQIIAGQLISGLTAAQHVLDSGRLIHADDLVASALLARGMVFQATGNPTDGLAAFDESAWLALRGHFDGLASRSALANAMSLAERSESLPTAQVWLQLAAVTAARGGTDPELEYELIEVRGTIEAQHGELAAAVATHEKGLAAAKVLRGSSSPAIWGAEVQLATTMARAGAWVGAIPHLEHALALREASVGPDHPDIGLIMSNLGPCYAHAGDYKKAVAAMKRGLEIREASYGKKSPFLIATLNNLADFENQHGDRATAMVDIERAKGIARMVGTGNPVYHVVETTYAEVLDASGKTAEARAAYDAILDIELKASSPELGTTLASRGALELAQHEWAAAQRFEERAVAAYEQTGGAENLSLWKPLAGLAAAKRGLDPKADVKALLDRAIAIGTKAQISDDDMKPIRDALAKL